MNLSFNVRRRPFGFNAPGAREMIAAPTELFPDPNLGEVTDSTNGWAISGDIEPSGGTGPGLSFVGAESSSSAALVGSDQSEFDTAVATSSTKTVTLTVASYSDGGIIVTMRGGTPVSFVPSGNGDLAHSVTAGVSSGFEINGIDGQPAAFSLTHISVVS